MKSIEINTSQNVKIDYQLASVGQRIFAFAIDLAIMTLVYMLVFLSTFTEGNSDSELKIILFQLMAFSWFGFYSLISEQIGNGQSLGKLAMGIKVIKLNGEELAFYDYFSRWSMRIVDIYLSIGSIAMLLIASNKNGQRLGDIIAGTTIIRKKSNYGFTLKDILRLNLKDRETHQFEFPQATKLEEKDVILIKQLLLRNRTYRNKAHKKALNELVEKLVTLFELNSVPEDKEAFLNKVISDYIILTR